MKVYKSRVSNGWSVGMSLTYDNDGWLLVIDAGKRNWMFYWGKA